MEKTKITVTTALFAALCCITTMVIKVPTPTMGYVHVGDGMVLLSGVLLGPVYGGLAAGIGSMLADLLSGYAVWAPGTFLIKMLTAITAGAVFRMFRHSAGDYYRTYVSLLSGFTVGETIMVIGYFLYNILVISLTNGDFSAVSLAAASAQSLAEIPFNAVQAAAGIVTGLLLYPFLLRIPEVSALKLRQQTSRDEKSDNR